MVIEEEVRASIMKQNRMEGTMKKVFMIVLTLSLFAIEGAIRARAQVVDTIVADVPFGFIIRDHTLPAGDPGHTRQPPLRQMHPGPRTPW